MQDSVELLVNDQVINTWKSYAISADLYSANGQFEFEAAAPSLAVSEGMTCKLRVNGQLELTGTIDVIDDGYDASSSTLVIGGRDLMGLVVDEHVETWKTWEGYTVKQLAVELLRMIPHINRKSIVYENGIGAQDVSKSFAQSEPAQTVFDVLRSVAASRGFLFYCRPDGTFVFGRPLSTGSAAFAIVMGENAIAGRRKRDLSKRYRRVVVVGQQQGDDSFDDADEVNVMAEAVDESHPLSHKTFVAQYNDDGLAASNQARLILEKQKAESFQLVYKVPGHSQAGRNWTPNELCRVTDSRLGVSGVYLVYGRKFIKSRTEGTVTEVTLGYPGLLS